MNWQWSQALISLAWSKISSRLSRILTVITVIRRAARSSTKCPSWCPTVAGSYRRALTGAFASASLPPVAPSAPRARRGCACWARSGDAAVIRRPCDSRYEDGVAGILRYLSTHRVSSDPIDPNPSSRGSVSRSPVSTCAHPSCFCRHSTYLPHHATQPRSGVPSACRPAVDLQVHHHPTSQGKASQCHRTWDVLVPGTRRNGHGSTAPGSAAPPSACRRDRPWSGRRRGPCASSWRISLWLEGNVSHCGQLRSKSSTWTRDSAARGVPYRSTPCRRSCCPT